MKIKREIVEKAVKAYYDKRNIDIKAEENYLLSLLKEGSVRNLLFFNKWKIVEETEALLYIYKRIDSYITNRLLNLNTVSEDILDLVVLLNVFKDEEYLDLEINLIVSLGMYLD